MSRPYKFLGPEYCLHIRCAPAAAKQEARREARPWNECLAVFFSPGFLHCFPSSLPFSPSTIFLTVLPNAGLLTRSKRLAAQYQFMQLWEEPSADQELRGYCIYMLNQTGSSSFRRAFAHWLQPPILRKSWWPVVQNGLSESKFSHRGKATPNFQVFFIWKEIFPSVFFFSKNSTAITACLLLGAPLSLAFYLPIFSIASLLCCLSSISCAFASPVSTSFTAAGVCTARVWWD